MAITSADPFVQYKPRMPANDPEKMNYGRTILISLSFFTVLMAWSYFNFKVPLIIEDVILNTYGASFRGIQTLKGTILALDNLIAVIFQPYFGSLSDRTKSKFGRRMPYILVGTTLAAVFFTIIPLAQLLFSLVAIILLFDFAMSIYRSVAIAILPDYTSPKLHSKASALQQFISNMGGVIAFGIPLLIKSTGIHENFGFVIVSVAMVCVLLIQFFVVKETPTGISMFGVHAKPIQIDPISFEVSEAPQEMGREENESVMKLTKGVFKAKDKSFRNMLFVVLFAYTGFAAVEAFFSSFAKFYMGKTDDVSSTLLLAYSVPMILTAYFWGLLGQKIGRKRAAKVGLIGIMVATLLMIFVVVPNVYSTSGTLDDTMNTWDLILMANLAFISMPWMCFIVNSFPIVWSLAPNGKVGAYTGVYYAFNQFAYSIAPIVAGINLDFFASQGSRQYVAMFPLVLICMLIAFFFMLKVKSGDQELSQAEVKDYQEKYTSLD